MSSRRWGSLFIVVVTMWEVSHDMGGGGVKYTRQLSEEPSWWWGPIRVIVIHDGFHDIHEDSEIIH